MLDVLRPGAFHRVLRPLVPVLVILAASIPAVTAAGSSRQYTLSGDDVAIYNLIGQARVVRGTGSSVTVDVTLGGDDSGELKIETGTIDGRQTLRVIYPGKRFVYDRMGRGSNTQVTVGEDGTFGRGRGDRQVRISGGGDGLEAWADLTISVPDRRSTAVHQAVGGISANGVNADLVLDTGAAPVEASNLNGKLVIDVGSGSVDVNGIEGGPVLLDTGSGQVSITGLRASSLTVDTGSGHVEGSDIQVLDLLVDTGSGGIDLENLSATDLKLDTGSGSVRIELESDVRNMMIDTGSGSVTVAVPDELGAEIDVSTGSGDIDIDVPHETYRHRRSEFSGKLGDGEGDIVIDTGSGGVFVAGTKGR